LHFKAWHFVARIPYQAFTVTRGTDVAAGKSHYTASDASPADMTTAIWAGGKLVEVTDVTIIHAR
jgi:hypothetical protein